MSLYEKWMKNAFAQEGGSVDELWDEFLPKEQKIYEHILGQKITVLSGKIKALAEQFSMTAEQFVGFLDGIHEALDEKLDLPSLTEDSDVALQINFQKLYQKMLEYKADHLSVLPEWNNIFDEETRIKLAKEQKKSRTVVKAKKVGRNDPCPCSSGKKYKKCCGAN